MKKNAGYILFIVIGMLICLAPFACMTFARTDETTEKKELAAMPELTVDGKLNDNYLTELGDYFDDHFAFRQYMVSMDSWVESVLFQKSSVDNVLVGKEGWLFYTDSLNDYLGKDTLSDRAIYNIVYNLSIMQEEIESQGRSFVFTIAPNKNSLYGEYMPYIYSIKESDTNNRQLLENALSQSDVNYVDLYSLLSDSAEILYLKKDSHWNNKGALIAYNALLDEAGKEHEDYEDCSYTINKDYVGDLNSMVYPLMELPEENYNYDYETLYKYVNKDKIENVEDSQVSVEDARVQTTNDSAEGCLLMYRDSFGNALLPFMANAFASGYFMKTTPYNMDMHISTYDPDVVIVEKVERKIDELAYEPAVMTGTEVEIPDNHRTVKTDTSVNVVIPDANTGYYEIYGEIDSDVMEADSAIYVEVDVDNGEKTAYKAFARSIQGGSDYGYVAYIPTDIIKNTEISANVYITRGEYTFQVASYTVNKEDVATGSDGVVTEDEDSEGESASVEAAEEADSSKVETKGAAATEEEGCIMVTVIADGKTTELSTSSSTLSQMEEAGEIDIDSEDRVIPEIDDVLLDGEVISIQRVEIKEETEVKEIPYETENTTSSSIYEGETSVLTEGVNGEQTITYSVTYVDGVMEKKEKISEEITKEPVKEVIATGTKKKEAANSGGSSDSSGKTVIAKEYVEDCGSDSGYWMIIYDDGSVDFVD